MGICKNKNERVEWIDCAKGIGIILVIMGHSICPDTLLYWLYTFHMPLFFFLSGLTFNFDKYYEFKSFAINKIKSLLIPYVLLSLIYFVWKIVKFFLFGTEFGILGSLLGIVIQIRGGRFGAGIWFLPLLFVTEILLWCILRVAKKNLKKVVIIASGLLICGYMYARYINVKLPWGLDAALISNFFMSIGFCSKNLITKKVNILGIFFIIPNILLGFLNSSLYETRVDIWANNYGSLILYVLAAFSGIYFCIAVSTKIKISLLNYIGRYSVYYYGLHIIIVEFMTKVLTKFIDTKTIANQYISLVVTFFCVIIGLNIMPEKMSNIIKKYTDKIANP